ncbi:MAG: hypothetical protein WCE44_02495 [Candidatus Velthaea sp.]
MREYAYRDALGRVVTVAVVGYDLGTNSYLVEITDAEDPRAIGRRVLVAVTDLAPKEYASKPAVVRAAEAIVARCI